MPDFAGEFCRCLHQFLQPCQYRGAFVLVQQGCRIFLERRVKGFCIRGFEKDQIPGRHFRAVLADGVVDAVLFGIAFQTTDASLADLHAGYAPVLPQQGADALLSLGCLGLVQPIRRLYRPENSSGRQFRGRDHQVEGFLFDFFLHRSSPSLAACIRAATKKPKKAPASKNAKPIKKFSMAHLSRCRCRSAFAHLPSGWCCGLPDRSESGKYPPPSGIRWCCAHRCGRR